MRIVPVVSPEQVQTARQLFEEYAASLSFELCFQNFQQELDGLPGDYASPSGGLWLAVSEAGAAMGCVALRPLDTTAGEMKRLYVRPVQRGTGLGKRLVRRVLDEARAIGYQFVRLDTTPEMAGAIRLYESFGFTRIAPYRVNPVPGALYLEIDLRTPTPVQTVRIFAESAERVAPLFDAYRQFYGRPSDLPAARQFLDDRLTRGESVVFAVIEGERVLGFTQLYPSFSSVSLRPIWILNDLFVIESARRKGFGERLLRAARDHARQSGAVRLTLSTAMTNAAAQALYERDGWRRDTAFYYYELELLTDPD